MTEELAALRWTLQSLGALDPDTFLAACLSAAAISHPELAETLTADDRKRLMLVVENARVGRRREELAAALGDTRRLGIRVAVTGQRVTSTDGFDALVVAAGTEAIALPDQPGLVIVTGIEDDASLEWALRSGADLLEGGAVAEPIRVAPVDVNRLRR